MKVDGIGEVEIQRVEVVDPPKPIWPKIAASFVILGTGLALLTWFADWKIACGVWLVTWAGHIRWV